MNNEKPVITVVVDSREKKNQIILSEFSRLGIPFVIKKLDFCDYTFEYMGKSYKDKCAVEKKNSLSEIASNFCSGRIRFDTEFAKAVNAGCKVTLLIEDDKARAKMLLRQQMDKMVNLDEQKKFAKTWRSKMSGNAMIASIKAFKDRYGLDLVFCNKKDTAKEMLKVFYKAIEDELKEETEYGKQQQTNPEPNESL